MTFWLGKSYFFSKSFLVMCYSWKKKKKGKIYYRISMQFSIKNIFWKEDCIHKEKVEMIVFFSHLILSLVWCCIVWGQGRETSITWNSSVPECWVEENIQACCINKEGIYTQSRTEDKYCSGKQKTISRVNTSDAEISSVYFKGTRQRSWNFL